MRLILASKSPRRREILTMLGIPFEIVSADAPEVIPPGADACAAVQAISAQKAAAAQALLQKKEGDDPHRIVLGADTVVAIDGGILGKPRDRTHAAQMLRRLSGRVHSVFSGLTLLQGGKRFTAAEETRVFFRELTEEEIAAYVASGEADDKAGAYALQGKGCVFVQRAEGDFFNVIGLPAQLLYTMLQQHCGVSLAAYF